MTFFLPSILIETIPPPADASTRISAISSCILRCICSACFIMACMFPGSFIRFCLFFQISHRADLRVRKKLLEALDFGMAQCAAGDVVLRLCGQRSGLCRIGPQAHFEPHWPVCELLERSLDVLFIHREAEVRWRDEK